MAATAPSFTFRPLAIADLPAIHRWMNAPHAVRWFGGERSFDDLSSEYVAYIDRRTPVHPFVVVYEGRDIGMVTWQRFGDFPDLQRLYGVADPDTANCDVLIGESDAAHRGLGAPMILAFLAREVFVERRITSCVLDPFIDNAVAIRAYEKAGFRFLRALPDDGDGRPLWLMELRREAMAIAPADPGPIYLRPSRENELGLVSDIDDDACIAFEEIGLTFTFSPEHPFVRAELARWMEALCASRMMLACTEARIPVGFSAVGYLDNRPFVHQIAVRRAWSGRGIGRLLVERALRWSSPSGELWLTTYDHAPWNGPWYERLGFAKVDASACGPQVQAMLESERRSLPSPEHRIAMRYRHASVELRQDARVR